MSGTLESNKPSGHDAAPAGEGPRGRSAARGTAQLLAANITSNGLAAVRGVLMARGLSPEQFGIWSLMASALGYANYVDAGMNTGYLLTAAGLAARGELAEARRTSAQVLTGTLATAAVAAMLVCLAAVVMPSLAALRPLAFVLAAAFVACALSNYFSAGARLAEDWSRLATGSVIGGIVVTVAMGALVASGRLTAFGAGTATVGGVVVTAVALGWRRTVRFDWPPDGALLGRILLAGVPVIGMPLSILLFQNLDRWIVATAVTPAALGVYGLGATIGGFLYLIPGPLAIVLFTRQIGVHAVSEDVTATRHLVLPPLHALSALMAAMAGGVVLGLPILITHVAPAYEGLGAVAACHVVGNCLLFAGPLASQYLAAVGRTRSVLAALGLAMLTEALLVSITLRAGLGVPGAAAAVLLSDFCYGVGLVGLCVSLFQGGFRARGLAVAGFFVPFGACLGLALGLSGFAHPDEAGRWTTDALRLFSVEAVYAIASVTLILAWSRVTGLLTHPLLAELLRRYAPPFVVRRLLPRSALHD